MAKRRMRRTRNDAQRNADRGSLTSGLVDQTRAAALGMVDVAAETAKAALTGMQEIGRAMADMAPSAARRTMRAAGQAGGAAIQGAAEATRSMSRAMRPAADSAASAAASAGTTARRATRKVSGGARTRRGGTRARRLSGP
jgi:hypothetical protein